MTADTLNAVLAMRDQVGFYLVTDSTKTPFEAMVVASVDRRIYALIIGEELQPENFTDAASITGPIMPRFR